MTKFRKKPVVIEAVQFTAQSVVEMYEFINGADSVGCISSGTSQEKWFEYSAGLIKNGYSFKTLESDGETQKATLGDWIIKGINGEFHPCKPDIFEKTYELVNDEN